MKDGQDVHTDQQEEQLSAKRIDAHVSLCQDRAACLSASFCGLFTIGILGEGCPLWLLLGGAHRSESMCHVLDILSRVNNQAMNKASGHCIPYLTPIIPPMA